MFLESHAVQSNAMYAETCLIGHGECSDGRRCLREVLLDNCLECSACKGLSCDVRRSSQKVLLDICRQDCLGLGCHSYGSAKSARKLALSAA